MALPAAIVQALRDIKQAATEYNDHGALTRSQIIDLFQSVVSRLEDLAQFDPADEYANVRTALESLRDWVITNYPKDANGVCAVVTLDINGVHKVPLTPGQMNAYKTQLRAVRDAIIT